MRNQRRSRPSERRSSSGGRLVESFVQAASTQGKLGRYYRGIKRTNEFIDTLDEIAADMQPKRPSGVPRFVVSSYFLHECFRKLTADQSEQFSFITGVEVDGALVLNQLIELEHDRRTQLGVTANTGFTHRLLIRLEQFGHRLLAHFHSHPGRGPGSTHPSGTDEKFQQRLETAGHEAVAAIFSRDGFIRFFRIDGKFEVEVFGEGVERYENQIFKISKVD
ncbi:MAG TPA: hypothetical protein VHU83_11565 [Bryobacteraceae bacterium]|nr:hypothetical protein [Bryobacteraceae bacterium]